MNSSIGMKWKLVICVSVCIRVVYVLFKKRRKVRSEYQPYFAQLNQALKERCAGANAAIIDMDRLDSNADIIRKQLNGSYQLRIVTKSIPSLDLVKYLMLKMGTNKLMVFSESFTANVLSDLSPNPPDILLGTPLPINAFVRLTSCNGWNTVNWLIDTKERLNQYLDYAKNKQIRIKINLEIDVGLHRGGFDISKNFTEVIAFIKNNSEHLDLTGLMGYDGHVPHVPFYINKKTCIRKAFVKVQEVYNQYVSELKKHYDSKAISSMTFNGGGSHTYFYYSEFKNVTPINDIAVGSGFLSPQHFPDLIEIGHQPALFLSSCILKKIESSKLPHAEKLSVLLNFLDPNLKTSYFMLGGGWPGELRNPVGLKRNYWWDGNDSSYTNLLPSQSIVGSSDENDLNIGDFVFYHPWEGDGMLCFKRILLYQSDSFIGEWNTYQ